MTSRPVPPGPWSPPGPPQPLVPTLCRTMAGLLLCYLLATSSGSWSQELRVSQPGWAQGLEGGSVTLPCSYNTSVQGPQVGSYRWEKEPGLKVAPGVLPFQGRLGMPEARVFLEEGRADLEIHDLRHYDAGTYHCLVTLHGAPEVAGNGTRLHVDRPGTGTSQTMNSWLWGAMGAGLGAMGLVSVIAAILVCVLHRQRQGRRETESRWEHPRQDQAAGLEPNYVELRVKKGHGRVPPQEKQLPVVYAALAVGQGTSPWSHRGQS
ncbi:natural cytotoxicity triggering receptor 3 [Alligator sinensis]|uniref:Natural cytotoxicity triggering receptor 3 n=1 Tax=Alligator sinensis TaxID=38654 RepID=A0A1U8DJN3_ALLSI|nr:natural cytotoxicity triggering receptor 3 [Alligator sinensis]